MYILYRLWFSSGKSYIGQTSRSVEARLAQHVRSAMNGNSKLPVHCAWRLYGTPAIEVISHSDSQEDLNIKEKLAIEFYNTISPNGYNLGPGGETAPSKCPEVANKIAKKAKGRLHNKITIKKMSVISKEKWKDPEYQKKVSNSLKAGWNDERRKITSDRMKKYWEKRKSEGWKMPESTKEKIRVRKFTEETRKKMSDSAKARIRQPVSDETRKKLSKLTTDSWKNKDLKEKRSKSISVALSEKFNSMTEEEKEIFSLTRKKAWETRRARSKRTE